MIIVRGTTPTFVIKFKTVNVDSITAAYLCFKDKSNVVLEKDISAAIRDQDSLSWKLTQEESFLVGQSNRKRTVDVMCDWKLADGTRGRSEVMMCMIEPPGKEEVI